jgi:hypothetical protein
VHEIPKSAGGLQIAVRDGAGELRHHLWEILWDAAPAEIALCDFRHLKWRRRPKREGDND